MGEQAASADAKPEADAVAAAGTDTKSRPAEAKRRGSRWWYLLLAVLLVEFYVYGRRAEIQVCVGKQGEHDFGLLGQERDDSNRWRFPRCEVRENLGLRSDFDALLDNATQSACRGQTMLRNRGEGPACIAQEDGWQRQIDSSFIPPWDNRYYEHLLWFLY